MTGKGDTLLTVTVKPTVTLYIPKASNQHNIQRVVAELEPATEDDVFMPMRFSARERNKHWWVDSMSLSCT